MTRWEYKEVPLAGTVERPKELNRLGRDGWELVTILQPPGVTPVWVFKRPVAAVVDPFLVDRSDERER